MRQRKIVHLIMFLIMSLNVVMMTTQEMLRYSIFQFKFKFSISIYFHISQSKYIITSTIHERNLKYKQANKNAHKMVNIISNCLCHCTNVISRNMMEPIHQNELV